MKFASFGRESDTDMLVQQIADPERRTRLIAQTNAAHDLKEGKGTVDAFVEKTREAVFSSTQRERDMPLLLLERVSRYYPECLTIWDELASSSKWQDRLTTTGRLYSGIPERHSDKLFSRLRSDPSERVRALALSRYQHRPDEKGEILFDLYDPSQFDERVERGEVVI